MFFYNKWIENIHTSSGTASFRQFNQTAIQKHIRFKCIRAFLCISPYGDYLEITFLIPQLLPKQLSQVGKVVLQASYLYTNTLQFIVLCFDSGKQI